MSNPRKVSKMVLSVEQSEGVGAKVRRSIGRQELKNLDPFLMLDEFCVKKPAGFPDHPHRGFETEIRTSAWMGLCWWWNMHYLRCIHGCRWWCNYLLDIKPLRLNKPVLWQHSHDAFMEQVTYLLSGTSAHEDFCGHSGILEAGDLQWMTAGRGVVHAEMPLSDDPMRGLQLWVNLRKADKMVEPQYQELKSKQVPKPSKDGVTVAVISGEALGVKSKIYTRTPTIYLDFRLGADAKHVQPIPSGWTAFIYTLSGTVHTGPDKDQKEVEPHHTVVFEDGDSIIVENKAAEEAHFVLIAGEPIKEPVVQHGPFVMNSDDEIQQTIVDYKTCTNGFERAKHWQSKIRSL